MKQSYDQIAWDKLSSNILYLQHKEFDIQIFLKCTTIHKLDNNPLMN